MDAEADQTALHAIDNSCALADQALMLTVRSLGILLLERGDLGHPAMIALTTQPAEEGALQVPGVKSVALRSPMLARHRNTGGMHDVGFDPVLAQPTCQPETVAAGLKGYGDAINGVTSFGGFVAPALQQ